MILAPVVSVAPNAFDSPVSVRLIGVLDRVLIESFADACAGLAAPGGRALIVLVRDLTVMRDESLDRFLAILGSYQDAGHRVNVQGTPAWRKVTAGRAARFSEPTPFDGRAGRRQVIICHSMDRRAGAA